jgi:hypothetical protein
MFFGSGLPLSSSPLSPFTCSIFIEFLPTLLPSGYAGGYRGQAGDFPSSTTRTMT